MPFVATAPVVAEVKYASDPEVRPVLVDDTYRAWPVVKAFAEIFCAVPAVVEFACRLNIPTFEVLV